MVDKKLNSTTGSKPSWLKVKLPSGEEYLKIRSLMENLNLATVCQSAKCPNLGECWKNGTATIMILGDVCTRGCKFCAVKTGNPKGIIDLDEPQKVAHAIKTMKLKYVVLTSVDRDDLEDLGAGHFVSTIKAVRKSSLETLIEVLTPDFGARKELIEIVSQENPAVFAHNIETVKRLTRKVRDPRASFDKSIQTLKLVKDLNPSQFTKSSLMLGMGETEPEILEALAALKDVGCDFVTFGQYLQPTKKHLTVDRYVTPEEFESWHQRAEEMGFLYVASGPLVRSSYKAAEFYISNILKGEKR